jgi:hypothetical protein
MTGSHAYIAFNDATAHSHRCLLALSEMKMGRPVRRPILRRLDLLAQVSARWLQLEGKKPWRTVTPVSGAIQQENRQLGLMTRKALTALARPCLPVGRSLVSGALVVEPGHVVEVRVTVRIGGRRWPLASAPS